MFVPNEGSLDLRHEVIPASQALLIQIFGPQNMVVLIQKLKFAEVLAPFVIKELVELVASVYHREHQAPDLVSWQSGYWVGDGLLGQVRPQRNEDQDENGQEQGCP